MHWNTIFTSAGFVATRLCVRVNEIHFDVWYVPVHMSCTVERSINSQIDTSMYNTRRLVPNVKRKTVRLASRRCCGIHQRIFPLAFPRMLQPTVAILHTNILHVPKFPCGFVVIHTDPHFIYCAISFTRTWWPDQVHQQSILRVTAFYSWFYMQIHLQNATCFERAL